MIDQISKLIIDFKFAQHDSDIIGSIIRFKPTLNTNLSWGGNYFNILSNPFVVISINILVFFLLITGYLLYRRKRKVTSSPVKLLMIFGFAGASCSLIDKVFWGGSLDFIQIPHLFTFDFKDCYLSVFLIIFVILGIAHNKEISINEYIHFCFHELRQYK